MILGKVDEFIRLLRYETMNLHGVLQGLKVRSTLPISLHLRSEAWADIL